MSKIEVIEMGKNDWIKEQQSLYTCKSAAVLIGREHQGDENGNTRYNYAELKVQQKIVKISFSKFIYFLAIN